MEAVILYDSITGNTRRAASLIADGLGSAGIDVVVFPVSAYNPAALDRADLVVLGSWTDGLIVAGQRPGRRKRFLALPDLAGKRVAVYCTYAVNPGKTLVKLEQLARELGGDVIGGMALHRRRLASESADLAHRIAHAVTTLPASS